jgi:hypothetical protein
MWRKWVTGFIGIVLLAAGLYATGDFVRQDVWTDVRGWLSDGGTVAIQFRSRSMSVNAKWLAFTFCAIPAALVISGACLCFSAFRNEDNEKI